jgi:hypothetical protein
VLSVQISGTTQRSNDPYCLTTSGASQTHPFFTSLLIVTEFENGQCAKNSGRAGTFYPCGFQGVRAPKTMRCDEAHGCDLPGAFTE